MDLSGIVFHLDYKTIKEIFKNLKNQKLNIF